MAKNGGAGNGKRVAVAMSGGVDSSVAAALLVEWGYEVVGVHLKLHDLPPEQKQGKSCCSLDDSLDARQVCAKLGIPFYVVDMVEEFEHRVIDYFVESYRGGLTPNPCVMCNRTIKSTLLLQKAREFGCDLLATGHYAGVRQNPETGNHEILKPLDRGKDQTYFLAGTPREELPRLVYPLAEYRKPAARQLAERTGLITWDKPDSQEVCFVPKDYRDFLLPRLGGQAPPAGAFVDRAGRVLGRHQGLAHYTVGQRRGLGLSNPAPLYVVELNAERNEVVLGPEEELFSSAMTVSGLNWVSRLPPEAPLEVVAKIRYSHAGSPARLLPLGAERARVEFHAPVRAITPGQAAAFYDGDVLLGGGWIDGRGEAEAS